MPAASLIVTGPLIDSDGVASSSLMAPVAATRGVTVRVTGADAPVIVAGVRDELAQVVQNLIDNAVKYAEQEPRIRIGTANNDEGVTISVSDNGIGLPRGEGEEMAAVKKLSDRARVLEGSLEVESTPGQGATLRLSVKRINLMATKKTSHE